MPASQLAEKSVVGAAHTSAEALEFCRSRGIVSRLGAAIDSAGNHFSIVGNPFVRLVQDPEVEGTSYVMIEIKVSGTVRDNVTSHRNFAQETAKLLGSTRVMIRLQCDIV
jgi:hypothetical protein